MFRSRVTFRALVAALALGVGVGIVPPQEARAAAPNGFVGLNSYRAPTQADAARMQKARVSFF